MIARFFQGVEQTVIPFAGGIGLYDKRYPDVPLLEEIAAPIEAQLAKLNEAMSSDFSEGTAFLLFFDINDGFWNKDISTLLFARYSRMSVLINEIKLMNEYLKDYTDASDEERKGFIQEQDLRLEELLSILNEIPAIVKTAKDKLVIFVKSINNKLKKYEIF